MILLRLKEILAEKKMTGKELADRVGVTQATISTINSGDTFPRGDLLVKIAEVLDVDVRELFHPTKSVDKEKIYVIRDGAFVEIGEIKKPGN